MTMARLPGVIESGMLEKNGQRKPGTTRGPPRRSRTAKASHISRDAAKLRCACERSIRITLSLAFLAPEIAKAAVEGRLPRGFGLKRLVDLPMAWPDQWRALGLQAPAQA